MTETKKTSFYECDKQIAAAFKEDCVEFLEEFEKLKSFKFSDFANVWQSKNFSCVFAGQKYALLLKELCESYFYIVKKFVTLSENIYERIGGLYLLYGLYYKQTLKCWVKIRLTIEEYKKFTELIETMKSQRQYEPVYIFAKMKVDQAFIYTAVPKPLGPEDRFVKSFETYLDYTFDTHKLHATIDNLKKIVEESDLVKEITNTNSEYEESMRKYAEKYPGLVPFSSTIVQDLQEAASQIQQGQFDATCEDLNKLKYVLQDPVRSTRSVREKAMRNKNAVYRAKRKVKLAVDLDFGDVKCDSADSTDDDD